MLLNFKKDNKQLLKGSCCRVEGVLWEMFDIKFESNLYLSVNSILLMGANRI